MTKYEPSVWGDVKWLVSRSPVRTAVMRFRHRGLRSHDCFLASYPKSGNTWMRHLIAQSLTRTPTDWRDNMQEYSIIVGQHHTLRPLLPENGRFIKTHEPYRKEYRCSVLMVRDPRDVAVSQYHFNRQFSTRRRSRNLSFPGFVDDFLNGDTCVYGSWAAHSQSWIPSIERGETFVVRYEDLKKEPIETLKKMFGFLKLDVNPEALQEAVESNSSAAMKAKEKKYKSESGSDGKTFVRKAESGQWKELFDEKLEQRLVEACKNQMLQFGYVA